MQVIRFLPTVKTSTTLKSSKAYLIFENKYQKESAHLQGTEKVLCAKTVHDSRTTNLDHKGRRKLSVAVCPRVLLRL